MHIFKGILTTILVCAAVSVGAMFYLLTHVTVDFSTLENYNPGKHSVVLDDRGNELTRFQLDRREPVPLDMISPHLIKAFLAAEDQNFFIHHGISVQGIVRSFITNFTHGKIVQGASTITQQLIKLLFLDNRRTFERKIKELFLAVIAEQQFSKEQILQTYLNHIYLGCGIYGVQAASQRFWSHSCNRLTIAQAATLAGIVQSPERFCPLTNPERAVRRRNTILKRMLHQKKITRDEFEQAIEEQLHLKDSHETCCAPHIKEMLRQQIEQLVGKKELYTGGYTIQTTISSSLQKQSVTTFKHHIAQHQRSSSTTLDGGFILIEGATGKIKALVGGRDFNESQFNRVTQARRQLGSIFKPLIYATALEHGASMADMCNDEPITIEFNNHVWNPQNYNLSFAGPVTRAYGLFKSLNTIAIQTLYTAGIRNVIDAARRCGLTQEIPEYPSLALGCIDATLVDATRMFNCFAQQGRVIEPYHLEWIKDNHGKKIYKHTPNIKQGISWLASSQVAAALYAGMNQLKKRHLFSCNAPLIGKTGTTNDARSCFFMGATPTYTAGAYIGSDDNASMGTAIYASQTVLPLVIDILKKAPAVKDEKFLYHPDLKKILIDEITGQPARQVHDAHAIEILVPR